MNEAPGNGDHMVEEGPVGATDNSVFPVQETLDSSVTSMHLDESSETQKLQVPLVAQDYFTEFWKFLKHKYNVESGNSQLKISFIEIVQKNDVIICTAQILENYLERPHSGDDDGIQLSGL
ncbi:hypothetical protein J4Q44_G00199970, partial [Coregonus suidteri]